MCIAPSLVTPQRNGGLSLAEPVAGAGSYWCSPVITAVREQAGVIRGMPAATLNTAGKREV